MAGGVLSLVAYGVQDVYLTGNPQITFWKVIYKRCTNFAIEPIEQSFSGTADFGKSSVTSLIARNGDLMTKVYLYATVSGTNSGTTGKWAFVRRLGHAMIKNVEMQIGGARIDYHLGDWMNVWYELSHSTSKERGYAQMIGDTPALTTMSSADKTATLYIPLYFWFNRNNGLALPLIALQYHDVRININFQTAANLIVQDHVGTQKVTASITNSLFVIDYVFLDSEERKRFATSAHEYLIEQLQTPDADTINTQNTKYRLPFNHPCKEIIWGIKLGRFITGQSFWSYDASSLVAMQKMFAAVVYLLSLDIVSDDGYAVNTDGSSSTGTGYSTVSFSTSTIGVALQAVADAVQNGAVLVTQTSPFGVNDASAALPSDFASDPLSYVDFVDQSYTSVPVALLSQTAAVLAGGLSTAQLTSPIYSLLQSFFVSVYQWHNYGMYLDGTGNPVASGNIQLNGQDRFTVRDGNYFNYVQPWQCHTNTPPDGINLYSFAINPEEHQPSGSCNFSRIDFSQLNISLSNEATGYLGDSSVIYIYATNYNILRIMGGMGGTAYSNAAHAAQFSAVESW